MQPPRIGGRSPASAVVGALLASLLLVPAAALDCKKIRKEGENFNLEKLGGAHSVVTLKHTAPITRNTTYNINICEPLKVKKKETCPKGTRVCGVVHNGEEIIELRPISHQKFGEMLDAQPELIREDNRSGLRLTLGGGKYGSVQQKAVIDFICNEDMEGTENEWNPQEPASESEVLRALMRRDEDDGDDDDEDPDEGVEKQLKKDGAALLFKSYMHEDKFGGEVLRLEWQTLHACSKARDGIGSGDDEETDGASHWGFFTWLVVIVFLGTSAYLIFGSWLNYTRYGARGWDLLPHGDTIRDIPYLMKDWIRSVINTVQSTGSRGGYSAV